jgi:uncharacterized HAD superfamily protein
MNHKTPAILVDIDGTIALRGDRDPYRHEDAMEDAVNWPVVYTVDALAAVYKWRIVILSARDEKFRDVTEYWLFKHGLLEDRVALLMRSSGDARRDAQVKRDLYHAYVEPHYKVEVVFDDRASVVDLWRNHLKLTCFQVADGNF